MTKLLEEALKQVRQLSDEKLDRYAKMLLEELEDEAAWDARFGESPDLLAALAAEARAEDDAGETEPLCPDKL